MLQPAAAKQNLSVQYDDYLPISCSGAGKKDRFERIADACFYPFRSYLFVIKRSRVDTCLQVMIYLVNRVIFTIACIAMLPLIILGVIFSYLSTTRYAPVEYTPQLFFEVITKYFQAPECYKKYYSACLQNIFSIKEEVDKLMPDQINHLQQQLLDRGSVSSQDYPLFFQQLYPYFLPPKALAKKPAIFICIAKQVLWVNDNQPRLALMVKKKVYRWISSGFSNNSGAEEGSLYIAGLSQYSTYPYSEREYGIIFKFLKICELENLEKRPFLAKFARKLANTATQQSVSERKL